MTNWEVTSWLGPFHAAVRPLCSSDFVPPWKMLVSAVNVPAPKTAQPVVPASISPFVKIFPDEGVGVLVGGTGVFVGVFVGGTEVSVGVCEGVAVAVGPIGVFVGVFVGGTGVFVGVLVGGMEVFVGPEAEEIVNLSKSTPVPFPVGF